MEEKEKIIIEKEGNQWCVLWGGNLQTGIAGFGDTIEDAMINFANEIFSALIFKGEVKK